MINNLLMIAGVFIASFIFGGDWNFQKLLKPCHNKHYENKINGIDFIYVINLDQRPEKYAYVQEQFSRYNIEPYRFSAVNGWELAENEVMALGITTPRKTKKGLMGTFYENIPGLGLKEQHVLLAKADRPCLSHCMSRGAVGIVLSHLSVIQDAYDSGFERVWIIEDDIEILDNIKKLTNFIVESNRLMKNKWDVLYTDIDTKTNAGTQKPVYGMAIRPDMMNRYMKRRAIVTRKFLSKNITKLGNRFGAYSYLINRSGMKKILKFFKEHHMFLPYDMELVYVPDLVQLSLRFNLVSTKINSPSDNGGPNYK
jgi:GR25 family glycosyltransferase involved in LPS biosynthesis